MGAVGAGGTGGISIMIERESRMKSESRGGKEGESVCGGVGNSRKASVRRRAKEGPGMTWGKGQRRGRGSEGGAAQAASERVQARDGWRWRSAEGTEGRA